MVAFIDGRYTAGQAIDKMAERKFLRLVFVEQRLNAEARELLQQTARKTSCMSMHRSTGGWFRTKQCGARYL